MKKFHLPNVNEEKSVLKTIRMKNATLNTLEEIAEKCDLSINRIINECIEYALTHLSEFDPEE